MPLTTNTPTQKVRQLMPGTPEYLLGSFNADVEITQMLVSKVALASDVATLTVQVTRGNIPAAGSLVTVTGTKTSSGLFNVNRVALSNVTIDASSGAGTISFALSHADVAQTSDAGLAVVDTPEVGEAVTAGTSVLAQTQPETMGPLRTLAAMVSFPTLPTAATVKVVWAVSQQDVINGPIVLGTVATVAAGVLTMGTTTYAAPAGGFLAFQVSGVTAGSGTIVAKLLM